MIKVCMLTTIYPLFPGDIQGIFVHRLARTLAKSGLEIHVVAPHSKGAKHEDCMDGVNIHRFQYMFPERLQTLAYHPGIPENMKKPLNKPQILTFTLAMSFKLMQVIRRHKIQLINAHWALPSATVSVWLKKAHKLPVLTTLYGVELHTVTKKYHVFGRFLTGALSGSDKLVAISDATAQAAGRFYGGEVEVLPDGVDTSLFSPLKSGSSIRQRYGLPGSPVVFTCGRLVERKGFEYLIRAMPEVLKRHPRAKLLLVGEGPDETRLKDLISSHGLGECVLMAGKASDEDLPSFYAACDVFVLPAIIDSQGDAEGSGTTLIEAMATAKPVIGSRVGGIPFALRDGGGFLVPEKDPTQLAEKINALLGDEALRSKMGVEGRAQVEKRFGWEGIGQRYAHIFDNLVGRNGTG